MAKDEKAPTLPPQQDMNNAGAKIDAIRDILFGQQIQDFDARFHTLKQELAHTQEATDGRMAAMHEELMGAIRSLDEKLSQLLQEQQDYAAQEISRLDDTREAQRKELGHLLVTLGEKLI